MANFLDILPLERKKTAIPVNLKPLADNLDAQFNILSNLQNLDQILDNKTAVKIIHDAAVIVSNKYNDFRLQCVHETGFLPPEFELAKFAKTRYTANYAKEEVYFSEEKTNLNLLSSSPKSLSSTMINIADKFNMLIIPFEFMDKRGYSSETYETRAQIKEFNNTATKYKLKVFALCPVNYYNLEQHANSPDADQLVYGGGELSMVITGVTLNLPMFRSLLNQISQVKSDVDNLKKSVNIQLTGLQNQLNMLQNQVEMIQRKQVEQTLIQQAQEERIKQLNEIRFSAMDPILFACSDFSLNKESSVIIGPCFGPDFDEILVATHGFKVVKGQREKITKINEKYR